jgi:hypothetical protein
LTRLNDQSKKPNEFAINIVYYAMLVASMVSGVLEGLQQRYYDSYRLNVSYNIFSFCVIIVCYGFFFDAWYRLKQATSQDFSIMIKMRDFGLFVLAYAFLAFSMILIVMCVLF